MQILKSKITLGVNPVDIIQRDFLISRLSNSKQFTLITAPSGFGKTFLISKFLTQSSEIKTRFSYYNISNDNNFYVFLYYYLHSINDTGELKNEVSTLEKNKIILSKYKQEDYSKVESILSDIFEKINLLWNENGYSILENIDIVKKELWFKHFVKIAAKHSKFNFIFTGITVSENIFIPAILNGQFTSVNKKDFNLNGEEIKKFSLAFYNQKTSSEECEQIISLIEGWISGLHLMFHADFSKTHKNFSNRKNILFEYFKSELIESLSVQEKLLLLKVSFLNEINTEILDSLTKDSGSADTFLSLSKKIPFLTYEKTSEYFYFSGLFKEFLNEYYLAEESKNNRKIFFENCAAYYEKKNMFDESFDFYLKAGNNKKLTDLIVNNALPMFRNGEFYVVNKWINSLDKKLLRGNKELMYISALLFKNFLDDRQYSNELFTHFLKKEKKDKFAFYKAIAHIAENYIYLNDYKKAFAILNKYLKTALDKYKPIILFRLHSVNYGLYNFDKCSIYLQQALSIITSIKSKDRDIISLRTNIYNALGNIFLLKGDFHKSIHYYKQVVELIDNEYNKFETQLNLCEANSKLENFYECYNILKLLQSQKSLSELPELRHKLKLNLIFVKYEEGNLQEALKLIEELNVERENSDEGVTILKLKAYFIKGNNQKIKEVINKKEKFSEDNKVLNVEFQILKNLYLKKLSNVDKFLENLRKLELTVKEIELISIVVLHLINNGQNKNAQKYLSNLIALNSKTKYINIINSFLKNQRHTYDKIISGNFDVEYFREFYFSIGAGNFEFYDIKVKYFGIPEIYFRGEKLPDSLWKRNKFKDIFLYLYFNIGKRISKDDILQQFYPDADKAYADNIFHQFLSNVRSVFSNRLSDSKVEFIIYRNKVFEFNSNYIFTSDAAILEKIIKEINTGEKRNHSFLIKNYAEPFLKNYYDEFAETQREHYVNMLSRYLN